MSGNPIDDGQSRPPMASLATRDRQRQGSGNELSLTSGRQYDTLTLPLVPLTMIRTTSKVVSADVLALLCVWRSWNAGGPRTASRDGRSGTGAKQLRYQLSAISFQLSASAISVRDCAMARSF